MLDNPNIVQEEQHLQDIIKHEKTSIPQRMTTILLKQRMTMSEDWLMDGTWPLSMQMI
jgi:hypothetical protein